MTRRTLGVLALVALTCTACGGLGPEEQARSLSAADAPVALLSPPVVPAQPEGERAQRLAFVRENRLVPVSRAADQVTPQAALDDLLAGPTPEERARGLSTALPAGAGPARVTVEDGLASVALTGEVLESGRSDQVLALAQVVVTLDALQEVTGVQFLSEDQVLPVPRADGAISRVPLTTGDYRSLIDGG